MALLKDKFNTQATGTANQWHTLESVTVAGGSVTNEDGIRVFADFIKSGAATDNAARVKLNGQILFEITGMPGRFAIECIARRDGTTGARVVSRVDAEGATGYIPLLRKQLTTGLSWGNGQALVIEGKSDLLGGLILDWGGTER